MNKITLRISGMRCASCAILIEEDLSDKVKNIFVDYKKGTAEIEFDPDKISLGEIEGIIADLGYEAKAGK